MSKEEILFKAVSEDMKKQGEPIDKGFEEISQTHEFKVLTSAMQEFADQESEKKSIAFGSWLKETILDGDIGTLYQYFLEKIYNK